VFLAAASNSASAKVTVGAPGASSVLVTADPPRITVSRSTHITATVFDATGNPLPGAPVYFDVKDRAATNFMDSAGEARFTDSNGQAFDVLRTREAGPASATVRARVPTGGKDGFAVGEVVVPIS
jgi:DNA/RNA-binding domain of Phe-tRNA-synthetase-like protein